VTEVSGVVVQLQPITSGLLLPFLVVVEGHVVAAWTLVLVDASILALILTLVLVLLLAPVLAPVLVLALDLAVLTLTLILESRSGLVPLLYLARWLGRYPWLGTLGTSVVKISVLGRYGCYPWEFSRIRFYHNHCV